MHQYATLEDTVYFGFAANLVTGAAGDGATPTFAVRLAGASASAAPVLTGTPTLLTNAGYVDGSYEVAVAATTGNGFAADAVYLVFAGLTISGVIPNACIGTFKLSPVPANTTQFLGTAPTEGGAGRLAAAFTKFFDKATPTGTINSLPDAVAGATNGVFIAGTNAATTITTGLTAHLIGTVDTVTTYTGNTPQTGDAYARVGAAGAGLTALGDTRIANLDATVSSRTKPADTQAAVTLVATTTNLTNLPAVPTDWLAAAGVKADAVTKIQAGLATPTNITAASGVALAASQHVIVDSGTITTYTGNTPQTGDNFAVVKAGGTGDLAAIQAQTDQLLFDGSGYVKANIKAVNDVTVNGDGTPGTEWGP